MSEDSIYLKTFKFFVRRIPYPWFYIDGKLVTNSISRESLLRTKKINVATGSPIDSFLFFRLVSFDLEVDGKSFHSDSDKLTLPMLHCLTTSSGGKIRIMNDQVKLTNNNDNVVRYIYRDRTFVLDK